MPLSGEEVRWVAHLARLELSSNELETMGRQLSSILAYVEQLGSVDTGNVEPLAHPLQFPMSSATTSQHRPCRSIAPWQTLPVVGEISTPCRPCWNDSPASPALDPKSWP